MDNLTHSLTGALAAKIIETAKPIAAIEPKQKRQAFWLLVASANLPDIDVVLGFLGDPIFSHIFFDVITPFGTQLFAPFSSARYALDWMFIIDPFFSGILALTLLLGRIFKTRRKQIILGGSIFVVLYLNEKSLPR